MDTGFIYTSGVLSTEISDHLPIFLIRKKEKETKEFNYINGWTYSRYDKEVYQNDVLHHELGNIFWNTESEDDYRVKQSEQNYTVM